MEHVCVFRHALALDERRVKFLPEYVCGGNALNESFASYRPNGEATANDQNTVDADVRKKETLNPFAVPHTKEVWFAGTHSDM